MKRLVFLALLLMGCQQTWNPPSPEENPTPPPSIVARGTNGPVDWSCELLGYNETLAWIQCDFQNKERTMVPDACIKVSFYDEVSGSLIVESRQVCSGILPPLGTSQNYAAFREKNRVALRKCGELLDLCVMLAGKH